MSAIPRGRTGTLSVLAALTTSALALASGGAAVGHTANSHAGAPGHLHCPRLQRPIATTEADWQPVAEALGRTGALRENVVYGISLPRRDLKVTSRGVKIGASLALNGSADFARYCDGTMLMGDLVLTENELPKATEALQEAGIEQTALHKHLPDQKPPIWWTHFHAMGDAVTLARKLKAVLKVSGDPIAVPAPAVTKPIDLDTAEIDETLGRKGIAEGRTYKFFIGRAETVTSHGHVLPAPIGIDTVIKFQALGKKRAAVTGDIVMTAHEVQNVLRILRRGDFEIVELHNHMLDDQPRLFYVHYWKVGDGVELARGLRPALDATNLAPPPTPES
ncbi:DUF1259 domain-containing protein [Streptomyces sp. WM6378]|uniref:DUF1259 domain-containing protein n=1 Tax=Streptomyces sp. WM6378 TaxID=1415557 RepID=UPI0006AE7487|nr:DUF1259 domain-containing protein [Streptomyces sp. WM6378]KOU41863.1 hypothetical protein ADK54_20290 [Streptomyces sp. WM6378]